MPRREVWLIWLLVLAGPAAGALGPAPAAATPDPGATTLDQAATADLGDEMVLGALIGYRAPPAHAALAQALAHFLQQSLSRDGLKNASVRVEEHGGHYYAHLAAAPPGYANRITRFVQISAQAIAAREQLRQDGKWNDAAWRLFLPLGLALQGPRAVQLLHFPPDTSLRAQDYLASRSSRRWERLLVLNGVSAARVARYERIVDIAPIAAPPESGAALARTYPYFRDYAYDMLSDSISPPAARLPLPVIVHGGPARAWVRKYLGVRLPVSASPAYLRVGDAARVPFLGANHPSLLWHVARHSRVGALRVMRDDLVAACWQARMGEDPARPIGATLAACTDFWDARATEICEQTEVQGYEVTAAQARRNCAHVAQRLMRAARALRPAELARIERGAEGGR